MLFALMLAVSPAPAATDLPNFEFRGITAGVPVDEKTTKGCKGRDDLEGYRSCVTLSDSLAGVGASTVVSYYNGKLSSVYLTSSQGNYRTIADAFKQKYGKPCDVRQEEWKSRGGVTIENTIVTWCFKSGRLQLNEVGGKLGEMSASYSDDNEPPRPQPKVDF